MYCYYRCDWAESNVGGCWRQEISREWSFPQAQRCCERSRDLCFSSTAASQQKAKTQVGQAFFSAVSICLFYYLIGPGNVRTLRCHCLLMSFGVCCLPCCDSRDRYSDTKGQKSALGWNGLNILFSADLCTEMWNPLEKLCVWSLIGYFSEWVGELYGKRGRGRNVMEVLTWSVCS